MPTPQGRRILILSNFFSQGHGGTPESVLLLARELAAMGLAVDVWCRNGLLKDVQALEALPAADDHALFASQKPAIRAYAAIFIAGSWNRKAPWLALQAFIAGVPVSYAAKGCLCRIEFSRLRDMRRIPYLLLVEWLPIALARRLVFSSRAEQMAYVLPSWLWRRRAVCLAEPFRGDIAGPRSLAPVLTLGFLAEISARKGLFELIDGFGHFLSSHPDIRARLLIAGAPRRGSEAYLRACRTLAAQNGAAACIEWLEPVRGRDRRDFYCSLDLFMCPSRFESFGLTPLEALWQGTPVCAAPAMGVLEHLAPDAPVLTMPSLDKCSVATAIAAFAKDPEGWRAGGQAWKASHALRRTNAEIAAEFADILLGEAA
jgi:glycosyltransferase involved in cell wall biosynthesis